MGQEIELVDFQVVMLVEGQETKLLKGQQFVPEGRGLKQGERKVNLIVGWIYRLKLVATRGPRGRKETLGENSKQRSIAQRKQSINQKRVLKVKPGKKGKEKRENIPYWGENLHPRGNPRGSA